MDGLKTGGRVAGTPNKATSAAREAIALFVNNNAHRLQEWLDRIAESEPEKAFTLFQSVIEYHVPKLARTEIMGKDGDPVNVLHRIERVIVGSSSDKNSKGL